MMTAIVCLTGCCKTQTTFEYDEGVMYPVRKIVTLKRGGVIANMEITSYLYNEDGSLA